MLGKLRFYCSRGEKIGHIKQYSLGPVTSLYLVLSSMVSIKFAKRLDSTHILLIFYVKASVCPLHCAHFMHGYCL